LICILQPAAIVAACHYSVAASPPLPALLQVDGSASLRLAAALLLPASQLLHLIAAPAW
jgi:hypothetical protein